MTFSRDSHRPAAGASTLAAALLALGGLLSGSAALAQAPNRIAWAPTREEAITVDGVPANMLPQETSLNRSLQAQRPRGLSRPAPTRGGTIFTDAPAKRESLPSVSGTPLTPEGLPVPPGMYYDEGDPTGMNWRTNRPGCDPCCDGAGTGAPKRRRSRMTM